MIKSLSTAIAAAAFAASALGSITDASAFGYHQQGGGFHPRPMAPMRANFSQHRMGPAFAPHAPHEARCFSASCNPSHGPVERDPPGVPPHQINPPHSPPSHLPPPYVSPPVAHGGKGCVGWKCGPIYVAPVLVATVGAASVGYYYGDQPIYYRDKLVRAAPQCQGPVGTFALISFVPTATTADMARFLQNYRATLSDGPNEDAVYAIKLSDTKMNQQEVQEELASMQEQKNVVKLVEANQAQSARN